MVEVLKNKPLTNFKNKFVRFLQQVIQKTKLKDIHAQE